MYQKQDLRKISLKLSFCVCHAVAKERERFVGEPAQDSDLMSGCALLAHKIRDAIIASLEIIYLALLRVIAPSKRKVVN
ncbi:hypothetical protein [Nostoc sp. ChiQUE01b]|uniref:hypothetical protein n=1 Tax=Nostoc sp. ChiQUE01b TaxID=3075376 RepID=UPI002AD5849C|nr:hypothetical protein [Nostoc sp. ChiQUE01b]